MHLRRVGNVFVSSGLALGLAAVWMPLDRAEAGNKRAGFGKVARHIQIALPRRNPQRLAGALAAATARIALPLRMKGRRDTRRLVALPLRRPVRAIDTFRRRLQARVSGAEVQAVRRAGKSGAMTISKQGLLKILRDVKPKGLPIKLAAAVITVESAWRPHARGASGEYGLMQLMPATARQYAPRYVRRLSDKYFGKVMMHPRMNLRVGTRVLHWCYRRAGGNIAATIGCYNRGPGRMWQWSGNRITKRYVSKVRRLLARAG